MTDQLSRADLRKLTSAEIVKAQQEGRLDELLAGRDPGAPQEELAAAPGADLGDRGDAPRRGRDIWKDASTEELVAAHGRGDLDPFLKGDASW